MNLAIFGGTFDPIHNAHLEVARAARRECFLDRILFVPAAQPPHKPGKCVAPYEHRLEMVRLACQEHPAFQASRLEAPGQDGSRNYTIQTIRRVADHLTTHDRLFFLIGADAFSEIATWYHWRRVIAEVEFIVVNRPGFTVDESMVPLGARVHWLRSVNRPLSSTDVRERLKTGQSTRGMLPLAVSRYITANQLYRSARSHARNPARGAKGRKRAKAKA
ncbi:MAG: nicotinate (nicotinamide) nucleotide adenylyltransferase [Acidobacteria bacterium]|nr:nicotinate (nicotinamide) nucleotide adenylyltransferase [Acidobacteriota bacterium]